MGAEDRASNKIDDLGGKAKEAVGNVTGDKSTENEGKLDQAKSSVKDAAEKVKDAFKKNASRRARHFGGGPTRTRHGTGNFGSIRDATGLPPFLMARGAALGLRSHFSAG